MKERLKRELNKTYLILSAAKEEYEETYEIEMILKNTLQTLLPLQVYRVDEELELFYDISSRQNLKSLAEKRGLSESMIRRLFEQMAVMMREIKDYLLDLECILLDLEHIYLKEEQIYFCYCPWEKKDMTAGVQKMLEEILGILDYHDTGGVELAYHLYQNACRGDFSIDTILKEHQREEYDRIREPAVNVLQEDSAFMKTPEQEDTVVPKEKKKKNHELGTKSKEKKGIGHKILEFFLTKEAKDARAGEEKIPERSFAEPEYEFHHELDPISEPLTGGGETVLLGQKKSGGWKMHPVYGKYPEFEIGENGFLVGKRKDLADGVIEKETISRIHSRLFVKDGSLFITDSNSTNGTFVNGKVVEPGEEVEIFAGDRILFADVEYECYNSL